jgi:3-isopropylmalate dehydratase small subunit
MLVEGLDSIGLTLARDAQITAFEQQRPTFMPVTVVS